MLQNIFNVLASGASQATNQPQSSNPSQSAGGDMLSGLLGSLLGGAAPAAPAQPVNQPQSGADEISSLLGSLLGGQTPVQSPAATNPVNTNPLANLVGSGQNPMLNMLIQPVVDQIAAKLGISPAIAMTVVTFAVHYMLANHGTKLAKSEDLSGVLEQHTNQDYLHTAGISKELASQTGLKPAVAANALSEVFKLLGTTAPAN
jgi:hypothetical protein